MTVTNDGRSTDGNVTTTQTATLAVLEGAVTVRNLDGGGGDDHEVRVVSGEAIDVTGRYAVTTVSATPSCYVYAEAVAAVDVDENGSSGSVGGRNGRPKCSDACYAFALNAVKYAFSALFP